MLYYLFLSAMPAANPISGAVSLVIAVTGHCDLIPGDYEGFELEIGKIFAALRGKYPNTPLLLLSGLAEGGDRIAVRAAMTATIPYIAVLPMPMALYRQDFTNEESDSEFEDLRKGALRCIEVPLAANSTLDGIAQPGPARDRQYELLGRFLVRHSQILIAIWDQDRTNKPGGTSHVVAMKLREESPPGRLAFSQMNTNGAGPVYVLPARRIGSGCAAGPALKREVRYPESSVPEDYEASYRLLDRFNADIARAGSDFPEAVKNSRSGLFEGEEAIGLSAAMQWVASVYSQADAIAIRFANASIRTWKVIFLLLALSGLALIWMHAMDQGWPFLCGYYGCLGGAFTLMWYEWKSKRRDRHEDYRALAEALRVQFFWMAAGLRDMAAEQYQQAGETVWVRDAMSECGLYDGIVDRSPAGKVDRASRLRLAHTWVAGQAKYFWHTKERYEKLKKALTIFASVAVPIGLIAPLFWLVPKFKRWSHVVAALAMWWAALAWNYIEHRGFAHARQCARMYTLFHDADEDLNKFERERNFDECERTIRELGREALAENGDWLTMHRETKSSMQLATG